MNIADLIQKYERMRYMNKNLFFDADEFDMIAKHYIKKKDIAEAERVVNVGLGIHPHSTELMITKAKVILASKNYEDAYDYLLTIAEDETNVDLLLVKFECLLGLNKVREADAFLDYILKGELEGEKLYKFITEVGYLYNDEEGYLYNVEEGYLYNEPERHKTAIMLFEKALKIDSTNVKVLIELAFAYEWDDNIEKAIETTNAIIDINPYSFNAWVSLGRLYTYEYEYELSIEAFDFALAIKEGNVEVLKLKALTYNLDDNYEEEFKLLEECIDASPDDASLYDSLIEKYEQMDENWGTDHHLDVLRILEKKAERFGPKEVLLKIAHFYLYWDKLEEAQKIYPRIPEEDKNTLDYYKLEGEFALRDRDNETAEKKFLQAILECPEDLDVLDRLAEINIEKENNEKAAEYLERIVAIDPEYQIVKFRLALLRFEMGEKEPFDKIINKIKDEELRILLNTFTIGRNREKIDPAELSREELMIHLDEARENSIFRNLKS